MNFYLFFLCDADFYVWDLIYLNLLLGSVAVCVLVCDFFRYRKLQKCLAGEECKEQELEKLMGTQIYRAWKQEEEQQKKELLQQKKYLEDLSDYIARWSHEAKLPLAALKLMNGRNVSCQPVECGNYFPGIYLYLLFLSEKCLEKIV